MEEASKCDLCSEEFDSLDKLNVGIERQHVKARERKRNFKCSLCGYASRRGLDLILHVRTHTGELPFKCEASGCGVAFAQASALKTHIKFKHSDERPFKCDFPGCLHKDKTSSHLRNHKKVHSDERPFACSHTGCSYRAKSNSEITTHIKRVHSQAKPFTCSQCDYKTARNDKLKEHMRRHSRKRDFKCSHPQCTASFKYSFRLKRHVSKNHGENNIQSGCTGCEKSSTTKAAIKDFHNPSGRPFQCPLCFKHFKTLQDLHRHCVVHTNEKPFQCGHCKHEAAKRAHVQSHISSVHADIKFPFILHFLEDRECLHCKLTLPRVEFVVHCKDQHQHRVDPKDIN